MKKDNFLKYASPVALAVFSMAIAFWALQATNWQVWTRQPGFTWYLPSLLALPLVWLAWTKLTGYTVHRLGSKTAFLFAAAPIFSVAWVASASLVYCILCAGGACGLLGFELELFLLVGAPLLLGLFSIGFIKKSPTAFLLSFAILIFPILLFALVHLIPATTFLLSSWPLLIILGLVIVAIVFRGSTSSSNARTTSEKKPLVSANLPTAAIVVGGVFTVLAYAALGDLWGSTCIRAIQFLAEVFYLGPIFVALGLLWGAFR